ncbi:hypothetical protein MNBD_PLANCTO02-365 [hydrothermal vent metagenome]|uniref:Uncharacterized protein n=1 Tax=hydrothermal vent metagenome TaxID=652676 RepID=A0A3B1E802_9ZZZZ
MGTYYGSVASRYLIEFNQSNTHLNRKKIQMNCKLVTSSLLLLVAVTLSANAAPQKAGRKFKQLKPVKQWSGSVKNKALLSSAPKDRFITNTKTFAKLWRSWSLGEKIPRINFRRNLVLVAAVTGQNHEHTRATLDENGNISIVTVATKSNGPGFKYTVLVVSRKGVKTVGGKPIASNQKENKDYVKVEVHGKLQTGIMAIGGETTGTRISANGITWEVDLGKNPKLRKKGEGLGGKKVVLTGLLTRRKGVEIRERWIVVIESIKAAGNQKEKKDYVKVEVHGKLQTGIMAIGGETTGTRISANGITWEVDLGKNPKLRKKGEGLGGKKVVLTGLLTRRKGVEIRERWIVVIESIKKG